MYTYIYIYFLKDFCSWDLKRVRPTASNADQALTAVIPPHRLRGSQEGWVCWVARIRRIPGCRS